MIESDTSRSIAAALRGEGFVFLRGRTLRAELERSTRLADWEAFRDSWEALEPDTYLAETGRRRRRRHAVYEISPEGESVRQPHQAHYQAEEYNTLQGGIPRFFEPIAADIGAGPTLTAYLRFAWQTFSPLAGAERRWRAEAHQMRIEASAEHPGEPTPEGPHRDGVDYVLVALVARRNIVSGTTTIFTSQGAPLGAFTLTEPFDAALVDDARVWHGVTAVQPQDPSLPASRDVLVLTLKAL